MIISHRHKFIFIKTHKTAGTSIEIALSSICGEEDILTPISPDDENEKKKLGFRSFQNINVPLRYYSPSDVLYTLRNRKRKKYRRHWSAEQIKANVSNSVWNSYFKFTVERNPYDRLVSLFFWRGGYEKFTSIFDFLNSTQHRGLITKDKYCIGENLVVDKVYQYEDLEFIMEDLSNRFQLEVPIQLPKHQAKSKTRTERDYKKVIDQKTKDWIDRKYKDVFDRFNYGW